MLIDSHAHLNFPELVGKFEFPGVSKIVVVGTSLADSKEAIEICSRHDNLYPTIGVHPNDDSQANVENIDWAEFELLAKNCVAIGECGLDYSKTKDNDRQEKLLDKQLQIAEKLNLPLVLHVRNAQEDLIEKFGHELSKLRGVFHCFSGDENYLNTILHLMPGFCVSFAGNITFKSAQGLRDLVNLAPLDRMLIETDSPFLSPEPLRGKPNSPENVKIVAEKVAEIKGVSIQEIAEATSKNAEKLFGI